MDIAAIGSIVSADGDLDGGSVGEGHDLLYDSFTEGRGTYQGSNTVVLDCSGQNLGGAGTVHIHQYHQRYFQRSLAVTGILCALACLVLGIYDHAFREQLSGNFNHCIQTSTGIAPQIQDQAFHAGALHGCQCIGKLVYGHIVEFHDLDICHIVIQHFVFYGGTLYLGSLHGDVQIVPGALSDNGQIHCGPGFSADHIHRFRQRLTCSGDTVHFIDNIVGTQIHISCRCSFDHAADLGQIGLGIHADIGTDAKVNALCLFRQFIQLLCGIVLGIRVIQRVHQATEHTVFQLFIGDLTQIKVLLHSVFQQLQFFNGLCIDRGIFSIGYLCCHIILHGHDVVDLKSDKDTAHDQQRGRKANDKATEK